MMLYRKTKTGAALAAGLLMLAACSRSEPEQPPEDLNASEVAPADTATPEATPSAVATAVAVPADTNAAAEAPPEPKIAPDAQMLDDADATGMTARVTRDDPPADNGQAPR